MTDPQSTTQAANAPASTTNTNDTSSPQSSSSTVPPPSSLPTTRASPGGPGSGSGGDVGQQPAVGGGGPGQPPAATEYKKWAGVYPVYVDGHKTEAEGRRVSRADGVEHPTCEDIADVCARVLGLRCVVEQGKCYSRDFFLRGRVRVCIKGADGRPLNPDIPNKNALLRKICANMAASRKWRKEHPPKNAPTKKAAQQPQKKNKKGKF
ncbi:signal recognition particle 19 kDa protein [Pelomyxa schiedti]|nr:signal recognition particle 19 kDa protein [Pelomyxa schiedti]